MSESGKYRPKSYNEMESQLGRIYGVVAPRLRRIQQDYINAEAGRSNRPMDASDYDRALSEARRSSEYQRLANRLNRASAFVSRNRPDLEEEPIDIFNPDASSPERTRNQRRLNRRTRSRR